MSATQIQVARQETRLVRLSTSTAHFTTPPSLYSIHPSRMSLDVAKNRLIMQFNTALPTTFTMMNDSTRSSSSSSSAPSSTARTESLPFSSIPHPIVSPGSSLTRSPSIKILKQTTELSEQELLRNEAVADYKERVMYERVMRGRMNNTRPTLENAVRMQCFSSTTSSNPLLEATRTLVSPQGYLIPVVPQEEPQGQDDEYDEEEGIFDLEL